MFQGTVLPIDQVVFLTVQVIEGTNCQEKAVVVVAIQRKVVSADAFVPI